MQPPPQTAPSGIGGPPPLAPSWNMHWRNGPYGRRGNAPSSAAAATGSVLPVTDPFAFGKQPLREPLLTNPPQGDPAAAHGFPPLAFPPAAAPHQPPFPHNEDSLPGLDLSFGSVHISQPGARSTFSNPTNALSSFPEAAASRMGMQPLPEHSLPDPTGLSEPVRMVTGNSGAHQVLASVPDRPSSRPDTSRIPSYPEAVPSPLPTFSHTQQTGPPRIPPPIPAYLPYPEPLSSNAFYSVPNPSVAFSHPDPHPSPLPQQPALQNATQAPLQFGESSSMTIPHSGPWRQAGASSPLPSQLSREHIYLQPLEAVSLSSNPASQDSGTSGSVRGMSEAGGRQRPFEVDSGTVSMFFKGDEAENEEILSSEKSDHTDSFQETMGHTYYQPLHARQGPAAPFLAAEAVPKGADAQRSFRAAAAEQPDGMGAFLSESRSSLGQAGGHTSEAPYENVENQECVQNQEVLPSEPPSLSHQSPEAVSDSDRYASFALLHPKNNAVEGGPNLEAPDQLPRPAQPDSVPSIYSSLSHRSIPNSAHPQELGTFIQQESGKPEQDGPRSFFKQIDSSPLGGDAKHQEPGKTHRSPRSQGLTPSPPKPTGVFQPSANSSFEPVRSHSLGLRPPESDQAKMVAELRDIGPSQRSAKRSPALPVASLGNLEQPPDNLETLFLPPTHPSPLPLAGSHESPQQGPGHVQMAPEKRSSARAQGTGKKCESPATTLWAHSELPSFGGGVLLAPAAPAVYVPAKQPAQGSHPLKGALPTQQPDKLGSQAGTLRSENLENPPKIGDEDNLCSQAGSGYASLLSSPPTEALQNQPILLAQSHQSSGSSAQPLLLSGASPPGQPEQIPSSNNPSIGSPSSQVRNSGGSLSGENVLLPAGQPGWSGHLATATLFRGPPGAAETAIKASLSQPGAPVPCSLVAESQQAASAEGLPPEATGESGAAGKATGGLSGAVGHRTQNASSRQEFSEALDFTSGKGQEPSKAGNGPQGLGQTVGPPGASAGEPQAHSQSHFYQQVTKDLQLPAAASQQPSVASFTLMPPGNSPAQMLSQKPSEDCSAQPLSTDCRQGPPAPPSSAAPSTCPPPVSSAPDGSQPARPPSRQEQQQYPPSQNAFGLPPNSYYYYRHPYDSYPYPAVDPRAAHLYYQDMYDPSYAQYGSASTYQDAGSYWYAEPERPSSRASHTSDRPRSRQGYPDEYYSTKSGWNDYYADYYTNPYNSGAYDARFRDPRLYDQRYWYNGDPNHYPKREAYPRGNSHERYDDRWQYDPRFVSSFDEDLEPRREPYENDCDCRSVHSELSGHSLHSSRSIRSRQSSFSSRSQQSQRYRSNQDLSTNAYEADHPPATHRADYYGGGYFANPPAMADFNPLAQAAWPGVEQVPSRPLTPEKFSVPHVCAKFGPGGCLIKALPNVPSEGQPALVELHSMEMLMRRSSEQEEMRAFPGPLSKDDTHKVDVINFAQNKATHCLQNNALIDKESSRLLWDFIVLLCRQNGTVVGTDLAELLLQDHKTVWLPGKSPNEANLIDFTNEALEQVEEESGEAQLSFLTDNLIATIDGIEKETERFRELLLYGRKKDALESAMKHGLWGHALLLASKMDSRTHARVMTRFANSLPINDPLQTVYQLMSGRMPAASTCCGDEKWGDWRPHLAMVLSNLTNNLDVESRTIVTMGDTLASKGLLHAAHFCYLMAQVGFGVYTKKTTKLVLIGGNHSLPFSKFASNEAIQRTEAYEYAQSLGTEPCSLPNFQVFKFIYACRLAEMGLAAQAFHYCEVISKAVLKNPFVCSPVLISQVIQVSSRLLLFDPQIKEKPEQELFTEPDWLVQLRLVDGQIKEGSLGYSAGRSTPQQYTSNTPNSELDLASRNESRGGGPEMNSDNPLLASLVPKMGHPMQSVQLMPSAPQTLLDSYGAPSQLETTTTVPFYPVTPSSAGLGLGLPSPPGAESHSGYLGSTVPPTGPPAQAPEPLLPEPTLREAGPGDSPAWKPVPESREEDFYGKMASMGRRSRSTSQSSTHMGLGRRSRTTSESSIHSVGRERQNSAAKQPSPPPPSIPEGKKPPKEALKEQVPRKSGPTWFGWLMGKNKNEVHLPDDKNKSIVWDEKKQRWVNLDEPEEESKPPPPPPIGFPQAAPSGLVGPSNPSVNIFSRKAAGSKARYVDILNANQAKSPSAAPAPAPADLFAPLAPVPMPANLFVPNSVPEEQAPLEGRSVQELVAPGSKANTEVAGEVPYLNSPPFLPGTELPASNPENILSGELSRSSSMSSLSREVSQHFNQPPSGEPPSGSVQFYNPSQFAQPAAIPASSRISRIGQRKYPTLK